MKLELTPEDFFALKALLSCLEAAEPEEVKEASLKIVPYGWVRWREGENIFIDLEEQPPSPQRKAMEAWRLNET